MDETKMGDLRPTREELEAIAKSLSDIQLKVQAIMMHAVDPKDPRLPMFSRGAEAYAAVAQAKKLVVELYQQLGVRPT